MKVCPNCGKEYKPRGNRQIFCSQECYWNYYDKQYKKKDAPIRHYCNPELGKCPVCGKEFKMTKSNRVFCNRGCQREFNRRKRREKLKETRTCPVCGKEFEKDRHHIRYCSEECRLKSCRKVWHKAQKARPDKVFHLTKPPSTLDQIIKEAQELGLSYGKYRALLNTGKTFEELKAKKTNF